MTSATPKPRAGEHVPCDVCGCLQCQCRTPLTLALWNEALECASDDMPFDKAMALCRKLELECDAKYLSERALVEALQTLQSSANCHLGKGGIMLPLEAAILHAGDVLAKHGR